MSPGVFGRAGDSRRPVFKILPLPVPAPYFGDRPDRKIKEVVLKAIGHAIKNPRSCIDTSPVNMKEVCRPFPSRLAFVTAAIGYPRPYLMSCIHPAERPPLNRPPPMADLPPDDPLICPLNSESVFVEGTPGGLGMMCLLYRKSSSSMLSSRSRENKNKDLAS